jgi:ribose-phosphate pyrophosphokinase
MKYILKKIICLALGSIYFFGVRGGVMLRDFEIVAEKGSKLAQDLADCFDKQIITPQIKNFADTEYCMKFEEPQKLVEKNILLVSQFSFDSIKKNCVRSLSDQVFSVCMLVDLIKQSGAKRIISLMPYLAYSRQDKSYDGIYKGAVYLLGKMFKDSGIDHLVCVDVHAPQIKNEFAIFLDETLLHEFWAHFIKDNVLGTYEDICVVSPDHGRFAFVKKVADLLGLSCAYVEKKRYDVNKSKALVFVGEKRKTAIIIDDMIDTGGTACNACKLLKKEGFETVIGCFTHAILSNDAVEKLRKSMFDHIVVTDSVDFDESLVVLGDKISIVSIKDVLCNHVKKIFQETYEKF